MKNYISTNKDKFDILILDFENLKSVQKNLDSIMSDIIKITSNIVLKNVHYLIIHKLSLDEYININTLDEICKIFIFETDILSKIDSQLLDIRTVFAKQFIQKLKEISTNISLQLHHSSSIYLTQFIDIKKLIVNYKYFFILFIILALYGYVE